MVATIEQLVEQSYRRQAKAEAERIGPVDKTVRRTALTAAVARVEMSGSWKTYKFKSRDWQDESWRLYDITGQLRFIANWAGSMLSRCILRVHEIDEQGNFGQIVQDPEIAQLGSGPLGVGDTRSEALRLCGIDLFTAGEAYLIAESGGGQDGDDLWWVVTSRQIKRQGDTITIPRSPIHGGGIFTYRDGIDLILRCWTPHPADTMEPDSSVRSAIPDLRKLEAIRKREFAELDSRLTGAGVLFLPDSLDLPTADDDLDGRDGFAALIMRTMSESLRDRSSAESMVPIIVQGAAEDINAVKHMTFWSPISEQLGEMWKNTLGSLGESLDVPPEVMQGLGGSNHWSAWMISDSAINEQIKPLGARVAAALTVGYLWPALEAMGIESPTQYGYQFDASHLALRPNRSADAVTYHQMGLISDETARNAGAWIEDDAPDPMERARRLARELLLAAPDVALSDPGIRQLLEIPGTAAASTTTPKAIEPIKPPQNGGTPNTLPSAETKTPNQETPPGLNAAAASATTPATLSGLSTAMSLAARRAMTLAGQRLIPHRQRSRYEGTPRYQLAAMHGPVTSDRVSDLLIGAWSDLDIIAKSYELSEERLRDLLQSMCSELLTRGIPYSDDIVTDMVAAGDVITRLRRTS